MKNGISADQALTKFISICKKENLSTILDIGAGKNEPHAKEMRKNGLKVDTVDFFPASTVKGDYNQIQLDKHYDGVWCAHTLEHQLNVNNFLTKVFRDTKVGGLVCITVPPWKDVIVGGHVTFWNAGLLMYNMVLAGFDCSEAMVKTYGYNISVIVRKKPFNVPKLTYDTPDVKRILKPYFPVDYDGKGFDGNIKELNWK